MLLSILGLFACNNDSILIPKPPTYLRLNLPEHSYTIFNSECGYSFKAANTFKVKSVYDENGNVMCHKDIDLGPLNGVIHFSYIDMKEPLASYVNFANDKVDEHKVKATAIDDISIINKKEKVYGVLFELQGDVASPYQFYLTDSVSRFVSGVVYFNSKPNYDSLKPSLDYLKIDLLKLTQSFKWKKTN